MSDSSRLSVIHSAVLPRAGVLVAALVACACSKSEAAPSEDRPKIDAARLAELTKTSAIEKTALKLGFIKLTDCAPLVMAKELGYFNEEGLNVTLEAQANWKVLLDRVISGELDGAHMLAGQPLGAAVGIGTQADVVTSFSLDLNGNAVTVSNDVWKQMQKADKALASDTPPHPITAKSLLPAAQAAKAKGTPLKFGVVFPVSPHNYELRYWLAAAGLNPGAYTATDTTGTAGADVLLSVTPPPQMPATLEAGTINGYCVGEPWNEQAAMRGIGVPVVTDAEIWKNNPEKVFGTTGEWASKNPKTQQAVLRALIRAARWLDAGEENRKQAARTLAKKEYVGADYEVIANSMTGTFLFQKTDKREAPDFNVFYRYQANFPFYSDAIWYLTQMRRWGQIAEAKPDAWYHETARKVYRPGPFLEAARTLLDQGKLEKGEIPWESDGYKPATKEFIDGVEYDGKKPLEYLKAHAIGNKE
ncbi:MAG TPA: CmpA/NrtA family ABC transporter substrate-binding protein [Polyangiaceae bacterium]|nr:CmpA/NrtA family ABC transporter substrate-binding protein [Polyangiaceae bacterium]